MQASYARHVESRLGRARARSSLGDCSSIEVPGVTDDNGGRRRGWMVKMGGKF